MVLDVIQITGGKGVCFPSSIIDAFGINDKIVMKIRKNEIIITTVERNVPRKSWNEAFFKMNQNEDDKLIFSDNSSDFEWEW